MVEPVSILAAVGAAALYRHCYPPPLTKDDRGQAEKDFSTAAFRGMPLREDDTIRKGNWCLVSCGGADEGGKKGFMGSCFVVRWIMQVDQKDIRIELIHGQISGKKRIFVNNTLVHESMTFVDNGIEFLLPDIYHTGVPISTIILVDDYSGDWIYDLQVGDQRLDHLVESRNKNKESEGVELASFAPPQAEDGEPASGI
jgi:hypothetical protein